MDNPSERPGSGFIANPDARPGVASAWIPDKSIRAAPATETRSGSPRERAMQRAQNESGHQGGTNGPMGAMPACSKVQQLWDFGLNAVNPNSLLVENNCSYALFAVRMQAEGAPYVCQSTSAFKPGTSVILSKKDAADQVFCDGDAAANGFNACACSPGTHRFKLPQDAAGLPVARIR